jgi:ABC-type lipoprotein release transport system permease subunit
MSPAIRLAAHKLRAGWRGWAALALLTAIAGGAVLTAAAGAIRTDTAYPRFLAVSHAADALVSPGTDGTSGYDAALGKLPGVAVDAPVVGIDAAVVGADGKPDNAANVIAALDGNLGRTVEVPRLLAGRLPAENAPGEVAVDPNAASQLHLHVGSVLRLIATWDKDGSHARPLSERVTGIFITTDSVVPVNILATVPRILATPALYRELGSDYRAFDGAYLTLKPGTSMSRFSAAAQALTTRYPATGGQVYVADQSVQNATVQRAIRPQAIALALFAAALTLTALLIVGQVAVRLLIGAAGDNASLAALGMTRRQLLAAGLAEVAAAVTVGAALAVVIAVAASPLTPIGPARLAEPSPGIAVNRPVLGIGFAAILVLLLARVTVTAWKQASVRAAIGSFGSVAAAGPERRPLLADRLAMAGASLTAVTGVRFALAPGRGRDSVPVRSALLGLAVAVAAVGAAVTFGTNLLRLVDTPALYGQTWDVSWDGEFVPVTVQQFQQITGNVPIADVTFGLHGTVSIGAQGQASGQGGAAAADTVIPAIGLAAGKGPLMSPTVLDGRAPRTTGEIVLGTSVLRQFGLRVGQHVTVDTPLGRHPMLITGSAVFPYFGQGSFTSTDVGEGAETVADVFAAQAAASAGTPASGPPSYQFALISFAPGAAKQADLAALKRHWASFCADIQQATCLVTSQRPNTVSNYAAIDGTPAVLAGVLALLGLGVLAQFTVASARRRRRDYAILKVLGLRRSQLRAVALWQASAVTVAALVIGIPLGVAAGRWAWQAFADQAGLSGGAVTPLPVLWLVPAALAATALVALPAARRVAALPAMVTLRTE